jgi:hypothetical protein
MTQEENERHYTMADALHIACHRSESFVDLNGNPLSYHQQKKDKQSKVDSLF